MMPLQRSVGADGLVASDGARRDFEDADRARVRVEERRRPADPGKDPVGLDGRLRVLAQHRRRRHVTAGLPEHGIIEDDRGDALAAHRHHAVRGRQQSGRDHHQRALAAAARTQDRNEFSLPLRKRNSCCNRIHCSIISVNLVR